MKVPLFMESNIASLLTTFELLMAYLCNVHAESFAGDRRIVVPIPEDKRSEAEKTSVLNIKFFGPNKARFLVPYL